MGFKIYPHRLLDLEVKEIRKIVLDTVDFTMEILESDLPELVDEIQVKAGNTVIADSTIRNAVEEVEDFVESLVQSFNYIIDENRWQRSKHSAKKYYLKVLNQPSTLIEYTNEGRPTVISLPLYDAIGHACVGIFDYSITKSSQMKYSLLKSDDPDRIKIMEIKDKRQLKYYFIKTLVRYGANSHQLIRNLDTAFGKNRTKAKASTDKLPKLFR